ncbi:MAG: DUF3999 family protein [Silvibacterium sp.]
MSLRAGALLLLLIAASPNVDYFRYERPILNTPAQKQQTCLTLDATTFAHAGPQLASLRLYNGDTETPYSVSAAPPVQSSINRIAPLNAGLTNGAATFDAALPDGTYSDLDLTIDAHDFIATVRVSGSQTQTAVHPTGLGSYTIFDFTRQKLGRSTVLHLPESNFPYLHFRIDGPIRPEQITGLSIERLPQSQPQYVTVATTSTIQQRNRDSVIEFSIPQNVPVDRIQFVPGAQPVNFSRDVIVTVAPEAARPATDAEEPPSPVSSYGNLLRIHSTQNGHKIDEEHLVLDAPQSFENVATPWTITIHNGDDTPIDLQSVSLQMVKRTLCFDAQPGANYKLFYGDAALNAPRYDYAELFSLEKNAVRASLGPEEQNPNYRSRPDTRPFTEKHPALLWIALIAAIFLLGVIALRSSKQLKQP